MFKAVQSFLGTLGDQDPRPETPYATSPFPSRGETPNSSAETPVNRSVTPASPSVLGGPKRFLSFFTSASPIHRPEPKKMPNEEDLLNIVFEVFSKVGSMPQVGLDPTQLKRKIRNVLKEDGSTEERVFYVYKGAPLVGSFQMFSFIAVEVQPNGSTQNFIYSKLKAATKQYQGKRQRDEQQEYQAALPFYLEASVANLAPETLRFKKGNDASVKPHQTLSRLANQGDLIALISAKHNRQIDLDDEALFHFGTQLLEKLIRLHSMGIVHCDIKPDNTLFHRGDDGKWDVFICDYGFAKKLNSLNPFDKMTNGTQGYRPPEFDFTELTKDHKLAITHYQRNQVVDHFKADSYALGLTLFTLLSNTTFKDHFREFFSSNKNKKLQEIFAEQELLKLAQIMGYPNEELKNVPLRRITNEKYFVFTLEQTIALRGFLIETFLDRTLRIVYPEKLEVIKGLLKQNPDERWSLQQALAKWTQN